MRAALVVLLVAASNIEAYRVFGQSAPAVHFESDGVELAGLLRLPAGKAPYPAIVLLPGSLASSKEDEKLSTVADAFLREGFAVLTTDSRGTGASGGDFDTASFEVMASDTAAAVAMLRARHDIRDEAVGLWGVSQGATWVAPLAAERAHASFVIAAAGPLDSPAEYTHRFLDSRLRAEGLEADVVDRIGAARRALWSYYATGEGYEPARAAINALAGEPWFDSARLPRTVRPPDKLAELPARTRTFLAQKDFDPRAVIARLDVPMLVLYGREDAQLPVDRHAESLRALTANEGAQIEIKILAGTGHDLATDAAARALMARWAAASIVSRNRPPR